VISTSSVWFRLRFLWLSLLLVLVGVVVVAGISHYRWTADRARSAEFALQDAQMHFHAARAVEWRSVARGRPETDAFNTEVDAGRTDLRGLSTGDRQLMSLARTVLEEVAVYRAAASDEFALLSHRDVKGAMALNDERVDPQFDRLDRSLSSAVAESETYRAAAEHHAVFAARLIVLSAGLLMLLALGLYANSRRRALLSEIQRESLKEQVAVRGFEADHDELTGLLNRRGFFARVRDRITGGDESTLAVVLLDLDGFKEINDTLGHSAGDMLLGQIGSRLAESLRESDTLARLGGDEFAVLIADAQSAGTVHIGERIRRAMSAPFDVAGLSLHVRASVGVAIFPEHGDSAEELLRRADIAMYQAKRRGTGVAVYAAGDDPLTRHGLELASELEEGLGGGDLVVYYQPKAVLSTGAVTGVEALVRWQHPRRGLLGPDEFVPVAERSGLIRQLTLEVTRRALAQQAQWRAEGIDLVLAINLSIANLLDGDLPSEIAEMLATHRSRPEQLSLEITESYLVTDPTLIHSNLDGLRKQGIRLSLDDFGTGYSSFTHLRRLPISEVKIDRSFIEDIERDGDAAAIVRSTIELAHNLNLSVVAEGVETQSVWDRLEELQCDEAQGYFLARPMPAPELTGWLLNRPRQEVVVGID
jgi:diguanylate cyclase (GGDEF)-like protein